MIGLAVVPLLAFGAVETWLRYNAALDEAITLQQQVAARVAERFKEYVVGELESDVRVAARVSSVEKLAPDGQRTVLSKLLTYKEAFTEVALLDAAGRESARVSRTELVTARDLADRSDTDVYRVPVTTGGTYYSPIYRRASDAQSMLDIAVPLVDRRTGAVAAILVAAVRLQPIWDVVSYAATGAGVSTFVVDEKGRVVAHPDPSISLRDTLFVVPSSAGIHAGLSAEKEIMAFAVAAFGERQLTVVALQPASAALSTVYLVMVISGATVVAALLAAGVLAWIVVNPITRRITGLASAAHSIAEGNLDVRADDAVDDEFGALGGAFNTMVSALREKVEQALAARQEVVLLNAELEERVRHRTADLERANVALERSNVITDSIIESLPGVFYQITSEGRFVRWNSAFERVTRYTPEEIEALSVLALFEGEDKEAFRAATARVFESGEAEIGAHFVPKAGVPIPYWFTGMLKHLDGSPYLIGMGTDVSALKEIESELRQSVDRFSKAFQTSPYAITITHAEDGRFVEVNGAFTAIAGYTREEALADSSIGLKMWASEEDRQRVVNDLRAGKAVNGHEYQFRTKSGANITGLFSAQVLWLSQGTCIMSSIDDITERKRVEEEKNRIAEDLKRSNKELEQFAYVASHDLQEPLRMVASYTQLLERRYKDQLDDTAREFIAFAVDGANRMQRLINDLLVYSRVQTRAGEPELVELNHVLGQARANLAVAIEESGALVTNDELPVVMADPAQLLSVLQNLIGNAVKFHGEEPPHVHISARESDGEVEISVRDNGIGIRKEHQERIFLIFQRLHNRKDYPGTGIGLALCKRIVERHGGRIWVESDEGSGATFTFTLPKGRQKEQLT
jgi:PAS domain S-box-containing protein